MRRPHLCKINRINTTFSAPYFLIIISIQLLVCEVILRRQTIDKHDKVPYKFSNIVDLKKIKFTWFSIDVHVSLHLLRITRPLLSS